MKQNQVENVKELQNDLLEKIGKIPEWLNEIL